MMKNAVDDALLQPYARITYKMRLLLYTGQLLMESGAGTEQILRDMFRAVAYMGIPQKKIHFHITQTTLMLNINDDLHSYTEFHKCLKHGVNMTIISAVSKLTWRAMQENYSLEKYEEELHRIQDMRRHYTPLLSALGAGAACAGLCKLFGGDWAAFFCTMPCASIGFGLRRLCNDYGFNVYAGTAISAFVATALACLVQFFPISATPSYPMIAAALFLVPGIPLINAADDMLNNYIISGTTRIINTLLIISSMTFGILLALWLLGIENFTGIPIQPQGIYLSQAVAAAIAAIGFSMIFNLPRRLLWVVAIGAIIAVDLRNIMVLQFGASHVAGSFLGAAVVGIVAQKAIHWVHTPSVVLTIPSVIPMIPGILLYRLLFSLLNIQGIEANALLDGIRSGVEAVMIIIAIAVGVTIPMIFFRPYLQSYQQRHIAELLSKRRKNED